MNNAFEFVTVKVAVSKGRIPRTLNRKIHLNKKRVNLGGFSAMRNVRFDIQNTFGESVRTSLSGEKNSHFRKLLKIGD